MGISYTTREAVVQALGDQSSAARGTALIDQAIDAGSRSVEALCHRTFYPWSGTRILDRTSTGEHLWFDADEMLSITSLTVDSGLQVASTYRLSPASGPPYTALKFDGTRSFTRDTLISLTGVFGACNDQVPAGTLSNAIVSTTATTLGVTDGSLVGVGDLIAVDTERMQVTDRAFVTGADTGTLTASAAAQTMAVVSGTAWHVGELLLLDAEQITITAITGNNLTVKRAVNGSTLAAHSTAPIFVSRTLTVTRAATGTTGATHLNGATVTKLQAPALVRQLALGEAMNALQLAGGGYVPETGTGENVRRPSSSGIERLRDQCYRAHGRKARMRSGGGL